MCARLAKPCPWKSGLPRQKADRSIASPAPAPKGSPQRSLDEIECPSPRCEISLEVYCRNNVNRAAALSSFQSLQVNMGLSAKRGRLVVARGNGHCAGRFFLEGRGCWFGLYPSILQIHYDGGIAGGTGSNSFLDLQLNPAETRPADLPGRHANHQGVVGHVFCDNGAGADEGMFANRYAANDRAVCAQGRPSSYQRSFVFGLSIDVAPRVGYVGEDHRRPAEHVILQDHAGIERNVVLNFDVIADLHMRRHQHILAKVAV